MANVAGQCVFDKPGRAAHLPVNRLVVFVIAVLAVLIVIDKPFQVDKHVLTYSRAILGAAFGPQIILLLLWKRVSCADCLAWMLVGFVLAHFTSILKSTIVMSLKRSLLRIRMATSFSYTTATQILLFNDPR